MAKKIKKTATEAAIESRDDEYRAKVEVVAEQVKLLFSFCFQLVPDIEILKKVSDLSSERVSTSMAMAPILGAAGMDFEAIEFETKLKAKRAKALLNLIETLQETEKERAEFQEKQKNISKNRAELARILGL